MFKEETYPKPFFSVYFKTSLFGLCLFPFLFWRPWHRLCCPPSPSLPPSPGPRARALPRRSCLKRALGKDGSSPPPSPALGPAPPRPPVGVASLQDSLQCAVGVAKVVNAETGQEEVTATLATEPAEFATTVQPAQSEQLMTSPATGAGIGVGVTIVSASASGLLTHVGLGGKGRVGFGGEGRVGLGGEGRVGWGGEGRVGWGGEGRVGWGWVGLGGVCWLG